MTQGQIAQYGKREGEIELAGALEADDARLAFIGVVRSPWTERSNCPKNMNAARDTGLGATIEVGEQFRAGLSGLSGYSHAAILTWFDRSERNLIVQKPRHATEAKGVFALRSPARPNPIGLHIVGLLDIDVEAGVLTLDAIDALNGTPVLDIKPYFASTDAIPQATRPDKRNA
ncbi:MAG: tRNA (N6-threonylcarbamoyladenosine(37)-N6)-methyltransferase TrmO [Rhizobiaceae bacterium]